ncbi:hypothetical protein K0B96_12740 [Horticoccus luteus]|uniref:Uncharacterized protein n=1 Tax=Horticoccus luteus TaxID=2862869 RepID=A0A8F9TU51_9BACT|nr:hypothetical protein [Horticoccus luteus]QYM78170.1 hypothetical protein K0B96_12740 [Horticoccus luteus]
MSKLPQLLEFIAANDGINDKAKLAKLVVEKFALTRDRSVYYCDDLAIRFSSGARQSFSNTVLSLSNLRKVDQLPFLVCLVTPAENYVLLANTTLLRKISHSSQQLRVDNIKGSFNGSDILRELEGIENVPSNIQRLFDIHTEIGFEGNLPRLVESTNNIAPTGRKFGVAPKLEAVILDGPARAARFVASADAVTLKRELDEKVARFKNEIILAALIENVNVRGRIIEYLIAGEDYALRGEIIKALQTKSTSKGLPAFKTDNTLGDYQRIFDDYFTETDVKTKIMILSSNPKGYNIDKILEFLATEKSVFMFYFVGVDPTRIVNTVLVSMFQTDLLRATLLLKHWSGRNSRGVSQFEGRTISELIKTPKSDVDVAGAVAFLKTLIAL